MSTLKVFGTIVEVFAASVVGMFAGLVIVRMLRTQIPTSDAAYWAQLTFVLVSGILSLLCWVCVQQVCINAKLDAIQHKLTPREEEYGARGRGIW